jgi:hypothetical protein
LINIASDRYSAKDLLKFLENESIIINPMKSLRLIEPDWMPTVYIYVFKNKIKL